MLRYFVNRNITVNSYIVGHFSNFKTYYIDRIVYYLKVLIINQIRFKTYFATLRQIRNEQYPIFVTDRHGIQVKINDKFEASLLLNGFINSVRFIDDKIGRAHV